MKAPHRPNGVLAFTDVLCMAPLCVLAEGKLTASYNMKPPHRPVGVLAFTDMLCVALLCARSL